MLLGCYDASDSCAVQRIGACGDNLGSWPVPIPVQPVAAGGCGRSRRRDGCSYLDWRWRRYIDFDTSASHHRSCGWRCRWRLLRLAILQESRAEERSEERRVGKSVDVEGGRRIEK